MPATRTQFEALGGVVQAYEHKVRPALMLSALCKLQVAGVEADVWKVDGLYSQDDCERIVAMTRRDGRASVGCILLGPGENEQRICAWLTASAGVAGFIGFAVQRMTFWASLIALCDKKITCEVTVAEIARRYRQGIDIFELAKAAASFSDRALTIGLARPLEG